MRRASCLKVVTLGLLLTGAWLAAGQEKACALDEPTKAVTPEDLDERIYETLLKVHKEAARLYNAGEYTEATYLFRGSLLTVQPLLDHHKGLRAAIDSGLAQAADQRLTMDQRAWRLYKVVANL